MPVGSIQSQQELEPLYNPEYHWSHRAQAHQAVKAMRAKYRRKTLDLGDYDLDELLGGPVETKSLEPNSCPTGSCPISPECERDDRSCTPAELRWKKARARELALWGRLDTAKGLRTFFTKSLEWTGHYTPQADTDEEIRACERELKSAIAEQDAAMHAIMAGG